MIAKSKNVNILAASLFIALIIGFLFYRGVVLHTVHCR
jgi:hypothetical protein